MMFLLDFFFVGMEGMLSCSFCSICGSGLHLPFSAFLFLALSLLLLSRLLLYLSILRPVLEGRYAFLSLYLPSFMFIFCLNYLYPRLVSIFYLCDRVLEGRYAFILL